jgi:hypothetical protein
MQRDCSLAMPPAISHENRGELSQNAMHPGKSTYSRAAYIRVNHYTMQKSSSGTALEPSGITEG